MLKNIYELYKLSSPISSLLWERRKSVSALNKYINTLI